MKPNNIAFEQIAEQLIKVFADPERTASYNAGVGRYLCYGWIPGATMSPETRPAYVATFGADVVAAAEEAARAALDAYRREYAASEWPTYKAQADAHRAAGQPVPDVGSFAWAACSYIKCCNGIMDEVEEQALHADHVQPVMVRVDRVCRVSADDFDRLALADELCAGGNAPGGSWSETDEHIQAVAPFALHFLSVSVVTDGTRYYYIDAEGYDYARNIALPDDWRAMFAVILQDVTDRHAARKKAELEEVERVHAARVARYKTLCEKWAPLMQPVAELEAAVDRAPWSSAERKTARRKLMAARRSNILAMCRAAFPRVKFSLHVRDGWGASWDLTYFDGPTEEDFSEATAFNLFATYRDTFDGDTDMAGVEYTPEEFCTFANTYMGSGCTGGVKVERKMSDTAREHILGQLLRGHSELNAEDWRLMPRVREIFAKTTFEILSAPPALANVPAATADNEAPAQGLALEDISDGVAVVGAPRTTYCHRRAIKAHGAAWNRTTQRWEATQPGAVESLRKWFSTADARTEKA